MDSSITTTVNRNEITRWATKILGLYLGQNTMVPSVRIFRENRLDMDNLLFHQGDQAEDGGCLQDAQFDVPTLTHGPKSAARSCVHRHLKLFFSPLHKCQEGR